MTRRRLLKVLTTVISVYLLAIGGGVYLRLPFTEAATSQYATYKDILPLLIAIPAAYLAFAFQRRNSYLQALRLLWSEMVSAVVAALTYCERSASTEEHYIATLARLSRSIEEVRGVFKNVPASGTIDGWYPFEPVKQIYQAIHELGYGEGASMEQRKRVHDRVFELWKRSRTQLLTEFDRDEPTYHHAEFAPDQDTSKKHS